MKLNHTDIVSETNGWVGWQDKVVDTESNFDKFVDKLEKRTKLKLRPTKNNDTLNGFVSSTGLQNVYIVSLYGQNVEPSEKTSGHTFKAVKITKGLEDKIYGSNL